MRLFLCPVAIASLSLLALVYGDGEGYPEGSRGIEFLQLQAAAPLGSWLSLSKTPVHLRIERAAILRTSVDASLCDGDHTVPLTEGLAILSSGEHQLRVCPGEARQHEQDEPVYVCIDC